MKRSLLEERLASCRRAGLSVQAVTVNPLATLNAWDAVWAELRLDALALLHLKAECAAEWIVRTPEALQVVAVSSESADALWEDLRRSWDALRARLADRAPHLWVAGPPMALTKVQEFVAAGSAASVERFDPAQVLAAGTSPLQQPERALTAIGLALQALHAARTPVNLLATGQERQRHRRIHRAASLISVLCLAAALWWGAGGMLEVRKRRAQILKQLETREELYRGLRPKIRALAQQQARLEARIRQLEHVAAQSPRMMQLMAQMVSLLPDEAWLVKLEALRSDSPFNQKTNRVELTDGMLEGRAKSFQAINQLIERLKGLPEMSMVKLVSTTPATDAASGKEVIAFTVQFQRQTIEASPAATAEATTGSKPKDDAS